MRHANGVDGCRIAFQVQGDGPPLVLLTGQANNHHWWDGVRDDFHTARQTITLDYRGTGDSDAPDHRYSTQGFAEDVIAVLDALAVERADVYGTSMGGRVAQWVAARHPDRVRRLVLGCTSPGGAHSLERDAAVHAGLTDPDPAKARRFLLELMYTPAWLAAHPGPYTVLGDPDMSARAKKRHFVASADHDAWDALTEIVAPTLVVHGDQDVFNPAANAPLLAERIPGAELRMIESARHAYFDEFRAVASPLVLEFLQR
ncbi:MULTISPECIES: alpha/beta fold hydrolase [Actinoalloteichus]|uniref:Hydrolase or acyltransferase of alpha/beta superfamily n=1 Tax=Actinoalloteichus fjordicus TaxID=1612552 RepID=A0AAC9LE38_9PSEU|nr:MULTISPECIES: alpha/beta fold hydrolase [Actinoalloteichus]APU15957.1 putative hydrolase or acyltransferase of alpha/beta superfamily [Actinoalloteichus fjordicus]APU22020.1 putative hydrolase or acyltransferase of alpha/beta superfamily [Actinoalloteichus sp. GBA129-24]